MPTYPRRLLTKPEAAPTPDRPEPSELARRAAAELIRRDIIWYMDRYAAAFAIDAAAEELAADEALGAGREKK